MINITVEAVVGRVPKCQTQTSLELGTVDALVKPLKVKPEGVPVEKVQSEFKCYRRGSKKKNNKKKLIKMQKLVLPANTVADSGRAWVQVTGDLMAPSLNNLGNLVRISNQIISTSREI